MLEEEKTELLICALSKKKWQVVKRPIGDDISPIPPEKIKVLTTVTSKRDAVIFAEGRQSATGEPIRVPD